MTSLIVTQAAKKITSIKKQNSQKRACQRKKFKTIPEMIGPTAKAEPMTKPAAPIVCPRLSLGVIVIKTV